MGRRFRKNQTESGIETTDACSLPAEFSDRLRRLIPADCWDEVCRSFTEPRHVGLRINTLLTTPATATEQLTVAGFDWHWLRPQSSTAMWIPAEQRSQLTHHELANSGGLYIQSLSSQLAAEVLAPQPGEQVLDLAAAPGGKTTHLAALMQNQGRLSAVESVRPRFFRLLETLKRQGVTIAKTYLMDGRSVGGKVGERFDRVLLDAPCSSESRFHLTDPKSFENWSLRKIKECARKQTGLICSAFAALRPGGRLLYATCSFAPEENEAIVQHLLDRYPGQAQLLALPPLPCRTQPGLQVFEQQRFSADLQQTCRILPDRWFSGFYLALIGKSSS